MPVIVLHVLQRGNVNSDRRTPKSLRRVEVKHLTFNLTAQTATWTVDSSNSALVNGFQNTHKQ